MASFFVSLLILVAGFMVYKIKNLLNIFGFFKSNGKWKDRVEEFNGTIGFFHPFCNDCGGGEKVLWFYIYGIQRKWPNLDVYIFTCDDTPANEILSKVKARFDLSLTSDHIHFILLTQKKWILALTYPFFTLAGQSFGSLILGYEAVKAFKPDIYVDTTGLSFVGCLFKLVGSKVAAYVHYPTISRDMISQIENRKISFNNATIIGNSTCLSRFKLIYYYVFSICYWLSSLSVDFAMVNSRWTYNHIKYLWNVKETNLKIVYPPCSPHFFNTQNPSIRSNTIISVSQFRPEKNHKLQLDILHGVIERARDIGVGDLKLILVGGLRTGKDEAFMNDLKNYSQKLGVQDHVEFKINIPFSELKTLMANSLIGIHTMDREHFGIGIVELMASGAIVIAHNSGGPKEDILMPYNNKPVGYLATTAEEYVGKVLDILTMTRKESEILRSNAIEAVNIRYSDKLFISDTVTVMEKLILDI